MIQFDAEAHIYRDAETGEVIPSVTQILAPLTTYYRVPQDKLRLAADRGTAVHVATEHWDRYEKFEVAADDEIVPFVQAWQDFRAEHRFTPLKVELRVYHEEHGYAGTLDRIGRMEGDLTVIDIKTSKNVGPAMGVQLAAYLEAANAMYPDRAPIRRRFVVQLRADGTYALEEFTSVWDFPAFLGCLSLWHWQRSLDKPTEVRLQPPPLPRTPLTLMPEQDYLVRDGHAIH